ncbi:DEAD/DEAH box helicase [Priestia megaterium]|uniref:DEAD/DEAH box helicase n=1 Tax=Priestia megaterium TaxID=1404 RepID=UPI001649FC22|nr:ATP-binding domain-containing protein [Priestia megaterium]
MEHIPSIGFIEDEKKLVFKKILEGLFNEQGLIYDNFPLNSGNTSKNNSDVLVVSPINGYLILDISLWKESQNIEALKADISNLLDKYYDLLGRFRSKKELRKNGESKYKGKPILILPNVSEETINKMDLDEEADFICVEKLISNDTSNFINRAFLSANPITEEEWKSVLSIIQATNVLQQEPRHDIKNENTKAYIIEQINRNISNLDLEQEKIARQIPPGPQRIRGLAGSGKTVVLAMKASLMHIANPSWDIAYIFYTQSLYDQIKDYITRFTQHFARREPNWNKLKILHGWGGKNQEGLYSYACKSSGITPLNLTQAQSLFGQASLLGKLCEKLMQENEVNELFDAILMDEAQDFDFEFFRFCRHILRDHKRLIWAYDEVQSLSNLDIPTATEIFGTDKEGNPLVDLEGTYENGIEKDYILYHCYRNPRPVLVGAHFLGMGLFREEGAIQFIPNSGGWEDIGYEVVKGEFNPGEKVTLRRPFENSPNMIEKLVPYDSILQTKVFDGISDEVTWVSNQIVDNIKNEEVRPEDILVICLDNKYYSNYSQGLKAILKTENINLYLVGDDGNSNRFKQKDSVIFSGIRRAKGNEAVIVYVLGFDTINYGLDIVQKRNIAFTAMTRCKGWCTLTGFGKGAEKLFKEINLILSNPEEITFTVPHPDNIKRTLDNIEYEKRRNKIKKADKFIDQITKLIDEDDAKYLNQKNVNKLKELLERNGR